MLIQLNPPIPVITPRGQALAHLIIDYGPEHDLKWVCFQNATGECWTYSNAMIRAQKNSTENREYISPFYDPNSVSFKKGCGYSCWNCTAFNACDCDDTDDEEIPY